jgi:hypothetical protein
VSETWTPPAPPIETVWHDPAATKADVLAALRLGAGDIDVPRIDQSIGAAVHAINQFVDRVDALPGPPPPDALQSVLVAASVNVYHRLSYVATLGAGAGAAPTPPEEPFDPLRDLRSELGPFKQRWPVA